MQVIQLNLDDKIKFMKNEYEAFHSENNYANLIKDLSF